MRNKRFGRKRRRLWLCGIGIPLAFVMLSTIGIRYAEKRFMPVVLAFAGAQIKAEANRVYQESIEAVMASRGLVSTDFYSKTTDGTGRVSDLSVNTLLVNTICAELAVHITEGLMTKHANAVQVPLGLLLGIQFFAHTGPALGVWIQPMGGATVNYESVFVSAGINQVRFEVWLTIESAMRVVNPIQNGEITMTRRVMLVQTVFAGEVPGVVFPYGEV